MKLIEQTGEVSPKGQPSRKEMRCLNDEDEVYILENPSMYLYKLGQEIHHATGKQGLSYYCVSATCKARIHQEEIY